jgi:hypothetical protein
MHSSQIPEPSSLPDTDVHRPNKSATHASYAHIAVESGSPSNWPNRIQGDPFHRLKRARRSMPFH